MASDVCKHCTHAGCLDVCPTGALFRTEFGTVVVQDDVCNGCGYCVAGCPFGVIERARRDGTVRRTAGASGRQAHRARVHRSLGIAQKCTLCYDRLVEDQTPACAQTCPTTSIKFGDHDELVAPGPGAGRSAARQRADRGPALRRQRERRRRRHRVDLPAARRARGLRPAAGPAGADRRPAATCSAGRRRRRRHVRRCRAVVLEEPVSEHLGVRQPATAGAGTAPPRSAAATRQAARRRRRRRAGDAAWCPTSSSPRTTGAPWSSPRRGRHEVGGLPLPRRRRGRIRRCSPQAAS